MELRETGRIYNNDLLVGCSLKWHLTKLMNDLFWFVASEKSRRSHKFSQCPDDPHTILPYD
jgi:hypothetical protein